MAQEDKEKRMDDLERKIALIESDIKKFRASVDTHAQVMQGEVDRFNVEIEKLQKSMQNINETIIRYARSIETVERKLEGVRTDSSSGIVVSVVIFSVLFVISLFLR